MINPSWSTTDIDHAVRDLPGVRDIHSDALFLATATDGTPEGLQRAIESDTNDFLQVRGSTDGRYVDVDVPVVERGRLATGPKEVFVTEESLPVFAKAMGHPVDVGDRVSLAFGQQADLYDASKISLIDTQQVRIAGVGRLADETLPDDLYPRQRVIVSPDLAKRYDCLPALGPDMNAAELKAALTPPGCSTSYHYYSLRLRGGTTQVPALVDHFNKAAAGAAKRFPAAAMAELSLPANYFLIGADRSIEERKVQRATQPTVTSLVLFGLACGVGLMVLVGLMLVRLTRRHAHVLRIERAMGTTRRQRCTTVLASTAPAVALGLLGAVGIALATSTLGPVGVARRLSTGAGFGLQPWLVVAVVGLSAAVLGAVTFATGWVVTGPRANRPPRRRPWWTASTDRPTRDEGVRAALGGTGLFNSLVTVIGCTVAVATVLAAVVFGANLNRLVDTPSDYGWPFDAAVITGSGYGGTNMHAVRDDLDGRGDVRRWGVAATDSATVINGHSVPAVFAGPGFNSVAPPALEGRLPDGPHEIALGRSTAEDLDLHVGDTAKVTSALLDGPANVRVVGLAVEPPLGQFAADRAGLGVGAYLSKSDMSDDDITFIAIDAGTGTSGDQLTHALRRHIRDWDSTGTAPVVRTSTVRPPEIVDTADLGRMPLLLGLTLALAMLVGLALAIGVSVRDRRRDLAIFRVLGFTRSQVRSAVRWQSITTVVAALVLGVPLGWVAGRWAWITFAGTLGARTSVALPAGWVVVSAVVTVAFGVVAGSIPARLAARSTVAAVLRAT